MSTNYDAFAGRMTSTSSRSERAERARRYAEGATKGIECPYTIPGNVDEFWRGCYDGFVRQERRGHVGPDEAAYTTGFEAGMKIETGEKP